MKKLTIAVLLLISFVTFSQTSLLYMSPQQGDSSINMWREPNLLMYNHTRIIHNSPLIVFIEGSGSIPSPRTVLKALADSGYTVLSLRYPNSWSTPGLCDSQPNINCYEEFRKETFYGKDFSNKIDISYSNSISNRLLTALKYYDKKRGVEHLSDYYSQAGIKWEKIMISGFSQGAGHAAYIATQVNVAKVMMIGGPNDYSLYLKQTGSWLRMRSITPKSRYFGITAKRDYFNVQTRMCWTDLFGEELSNALSIDPSDLAKCSGQVIEMTKDFGENHPAGVDQLFFVPFWINAINR